MTAMVAFWQVPQLPADPDALSTAAQSLDSAVRDLAQDARDVVTVWSGMAGPYDTPDSAELVSKMTLVGDAGEDFATSLSTAAAALETLADALAAARSRTDNLTAEIPHFRQQVMSSRADLREQFGEDWADETWAFGQYETNARLLAECAGVQALIDQAAEDCERELRRIGEVPFRVEAVVGMRSTAGMGTPMAQDAAFRATLTLSILNRLSAHDGARAARLLEKHPSWLTLLQRTPPPRQPRRSRLRRRRLRGRRRRRPVARHRSQRGSRSDDGLGYTASRTPA